MLAQRLRGPSTNSKWDDAFADMAAGQQAALSKLPARPKVESVWCLLRADAGTSSAGVEEHALIVDYNRCVQSRAENAKARISSEPA